MLDYFTLIKNKILDSCEAVNGVSAFCSWWPMWHTQDKVNIYSLHFQKLDECGDFLAPNSTVIVDYVHDATSSRIMPPKKLMLWQRDLVPGLKYQIHICAWERGKEAKDSTSDGKRFARVTGFGQHYCQKFEQTVAGHRIDYLQMPLEAPRAFPPQPITKISREETEIIFPAEEFAKTILSGVENFDVIYRIMSISGLGEKYTQCDGCHLMRFITESDGNIAKIPLIPAGFEIRPFLRYRNRIGPGPYSDALRHTKDISYDDINPGQFTGDETDFSVHHVIKKMGNLLFTIESSEKSGDFWFAHTRNDDVFIVNTKEKCQVAAERIFECKLPLQETTDFVEIRTEMQKKIATIYLNEVTGELEIYSQPSNAFLRRHFGQLHNLRYDQLN